MKYDLSQVVKAAEERMCAEDVLAWFQTSFGNLHYVILFRRGPNLVQPYSVHAYVPERGEFHAGNYCKTREEAEEVFIGHMKDDIERCRHYRMRLEKGGKAE